MTASSDPAEFPRDATAGDAAEPDADTRESTVVPDAESTTPTALAASERLLRAVRADEPLADHLNAVADLDEAAVETLEGAAATAFWVNCYNAATQVLLEERPDLYDSSIRFFRAEAITVAGESLSLDQIEHGILRGSSKYGLGYVPRIFASSFERRHQRSELDPRIHFALNCAAESCPPIAAYSVDADAEFDLAATGYLESAVEYEPEAGVVRVPRVCLWFRGDFGGPSGVVDMLHEYDVIPADADPSVKYLDWDWSRDPKDFVDAT